MLYVRREKILRAPPSGWVASGCNGLAYDTLYYPAVVCTVRKCSSHSIALFFATMAQMDALLTPTRLLWAAGIIVVTLLLRFIREMIFHRRLVRGLPGPPHSMIWGHLLAMNEVVKEQPKRASPQTFSVFIKEKYGLGDYFYIDPWPFGDPIMMIFDTDIMAEFTVKQSLPKHPAVDDFVQHLGGPGNLVSSEGAEWKKWRAAFNPGFSANHLMSLVPLIVDECKIFEDILTQHAKNNEVFRMERETTCLTVDIIGKVILDKSFNSQKGPNELVDTFMRQVRWMKIGTQFNPIEAIDWPIRAPMQWYLTCVYPPRALFLKFLR